MTSHEKEVSSIRCISAKLSPERSEVRREAAGTGHPFELVQMERTQKASEAKSSGDDW